MFKLAIKKGLDKKLRRLRTKDREMLRLIERKVNDILVDPTSRLAITTTALLTMANLTREFTRHQTLGAI